MAHTNTGDWNTGGWNTGGWNTGNRNTGNWNTGNWNTGNRNTGDWNTGNWNTGDRNTGNRNTGCFNTGDRNTGGWNTGNWNAGGWNTGSWNTGDWNTGCFNTGTPDGAYYFGKWLKTVDWDKAKKPEWVYKPSSTTWVSDSDMTDAEKSAEPTCHTCGGYLRTNDMREEWLKAYKTATPEEIQMVRDLPNFDAVVFEEITGLDLANEKSCNGKTVEIDGVAYRLVRK